MDIKKQNQKIKELKVIVDDMTEKSTPIPITNFSIAHLLKLTLLEFENFLQIKNDDPIIKQYKSLKRYLFYAYSFTNKFHKGIELYIDEEIIPDSEIQDLKIIVDINDYQKKLQKFKMNQEFIHIKNSRDKIISPDDSKISKDEISELEELGIEIIEEDQ